MIYLTSIGLLHDRLEGTWERTIVAGAKPYHFLMSRIIEGLFLMLITFVVFGGYAIWYLIDELTFSSAILLFLLMMVSASVGMTTGILFSIYISSPREAMTLTLLMAFFATFLSSKFLTFINYIEVHQLSSTGITWPLEGMPYFLQCFSYFMPFAQTVAASRSIVLKASSILSPTVYKAFFTLFAWLFGQFIVSLILLKKKPT